MSENRFDVITHPTNAEKYKEVIDKTFGVSVLVATEWDCPPKYIHRECPLDKEGNSAFYTCEECRKWWNEEYKEVNT